VVLGSTVRHHSARCWPGVMESIQRREQCLASSSTTGVLGLASRSTYVCRRLGGNRRGKSTNKEAQGPRGNRHARTRKQHVKLFFQSKQKLYRRESHLHTMIVSCGVQRSKTIVTKGAVQHCHVCPFGSVHGKHSKCAEARRPQLQRRRR
jgi:hypothetical protein